ncbi:hypothetical protein [Streptomyces violascens]|uniref:hypothetical protein n=1 Tax=Streptomyces violascens TaxID=67381 RepID=UPI00368B9B19
MNATLPLPRTARGARLLHLAVKLDTPLLLTGTVAAVAAATGNLTPGRLGTVAVTAVVALAIWVGWFEKPVLARIDRRMLDRLPAAEWLAYTGLATSYKTAPPTAAEYSQATGWRWDPIDFEIHQNLALSTVKETVR